MSGKNPAFMYYPKDWRADSVFGCSLAARGLWHEMMNMMHASERYGYLCSNGRPIPEEAIARYCGCSIQEYTTLLAELTEANVPRRTTSGIIFSKRMVEDDKKRKEWRKRQTKHRVTARDVTRLSRESHADLQFPSPYPIANSKAEEEATAAAWVAIGFAKPFGQPKFQNLWLRNHQEAVSKGKWLTGAMEDTIQGCQSARIGIPPQFYEAKHDIEKREAADFERLHQRTPL